jgi:hypothetical protein
MKNIYEPLDIAVIRLDCYDCIRTSSSNFEDYNENELPLVPFEP